MCCVAVMIVTGGQGASTSAEIIFGNGTTCALPPLTQGRVYSSQAGLTVCGGAGPGHSTRTCATLRQGPPPTISCKAAFFMKAGTLQKASFCLVDVTASGQQRFCQKQLIPVKQNFLFPMTQSKRGTKPSCNLQHKHLANYVIQASSFYKNYKTNYQNS